MKYLYIEPCSTLTIDGKTVKTGDVVELTEAQAERHRFRVRPVEDTKPAKAKK